MMVRGITSVRALSRKLRIPRSTIARDVDAINAEWVAETKSNAETAFNRQLQSIQWRRAEIIDEWDRSKLSATTTTEKTGGEKPETITTTRQQTANIAYMNALQALDEQEAKLLRLFDKPVDTSKEDSEALSLKYARMTKEELLEEYADLMNDFAAHEHKKQLDSAGEPGGYRNHPPKPVEYTTEDKALDDFNQTHGE